MTTAWGADAAATDVHLHVRPTAKICEPYALYYNLNGSYTALFDLGSSIAGGQKTASFQYSPATCVLLVTLAGVLSTTRRRSE